MEAIIPMQELIADLCQQHINVQKECPCTWHNQETGEDITTFRGKTYRNLTFQQVCDLKTCREFGIYHNLCQALDYQDWLIGHPADRNAEYYLREMRKNLNLRN